MEMKMSKKKTRDLDELMSENLERKALFVRETVNEEDRTVELSFSSEKPVLRWFGNEKLGHDPDHVDLVRLNDGGAVLMDHDHRDLVAVVESAWLDSDSRKGRAKVRFGKSARAEEIFNDVKDDIRRNVSVGYTIQQYQVTEVEGGEDEVLVTKWTPHEISIVSIPADETVGVGRSLKFKQTEKVNKMDEEVKNENEDQIRKTAAAETRKTVADIYGLGKRHNMEELAQRFVEEGRSLPEMNSAVLAAIEERNTPKSVDIATEIGLTDQEVKRFSMMNAIRALHSKNWKDAGFERECSVAIAEKLGREARGLFIPMEVQRVMGVAAGTGISDAGALVGTDHLDTAFIDALRAKSMMGDLGANIIDGLVGDVDIPRLDASASFYWLDEDENVTDSDETLGSVSFSPKTVAGSVPITRKLLKQSSPSVEALIMNDLMLGAALAIDKGVIAGDGIKEPLGILNQTGINTQAVADAVNFIPTWAELVGFETKVLDDNALRGKASYLTTPTIRGGMKTTEKSAGTAKYLIEDNMANGYDIYGSTQMASSQMLYGDWSSVLIALWGVLDITVDEAAKAASGGLVLRVFQDVDAGCRHPQSFCKRA